ncbi:hypothetical protein [Rhodococcus aetherivorans]|uniref:hypothetical protein n=1 Tax=Rhodococcus aetherivorans TaxID=191292 RepID=UPI00045CA711|nr:hypothetical protein [Rhodococcus aetherivorans]KDE14230.1 hypothetical protein N505_0105255 [Rhodococcus aetherivorans]
MPEPIDITEARRLLDEALPGPWNLELTMWMRDNLPALLDRIESLEADLERAHLARAEAQNRASDLRKAADGWASHAEKTESALFEARATNTRLNRRCQLAEKAARENIDACKRAGMSFGRSLANYAALLYREDLERAQATIARVQKLIDDAEQSPSRGVQFGGTPFPASVGTDQLRAALDGDQ